MNDNDKVCLHCQKPLKGRVDKKFCDDYCRNNYNNRLNSDATPLVRNINNTLRRNRRILEEVKTGGDKFGFATREKLLSKGFRFQYCTHTYTNNQGETYYYCYDYGYVWKDDKKRYMIVKALPELLEKS